MAYRSVSYAADNFQSDSRRIEYRTVAKESCNNRNDPGSELMLLILSYISIPGQNLQAVGVSYTSSNRSNQNHFSHTTQPPTPTYASPSHDPTEAVSKLVQHAHLPPLLHRLRHQISRPAILVKVLLLDLLFGWGLDDLQEWWDCAASG